MAALRASDQVFSLGPAGTGKTYIAARWAIRQVLDGKKERVVIARPTVSKAHHKLGYRPGDQDSKVADWLVPLLDGFRDEVSAATLTKMRTTGQVEFAAFETMRGRSFRNSVVLLDEAQNCDTSDLMLFLTRTGENSQVIVNGDQDQIDVPNSGLVEIVDMIARHNITAAVVRFGAADVVRSAIAREWVAAFAAERNK